MPHTLRLTCLAFALLLALPAASEESREQIRIVGSSTLYPFVTAAAEVFGLSGTFRTPIVESTGTGGGFKLFCSGAGMDTPDINDASRPIEPVEAALCMKNGVGRITELTLGYDGIALVNAIKGPHFSLTKKQIFMALARELPDAHGKMVKNPYTKWNEIDPALPNEPIEVYGRPPTSGTRDAFAEMVMDKGCEAFPEFRAAYPDEANRKNACEVMREDGRYIDASDNNIILQKLAYNPGALGMVGYSYLAENSARMQGSAIDGVMPEEANIENGSYTVSRSLFVYIKNAHVGKVPGLAEFAREITSDEAIGPDGYLVQRGLIPLSGEQRKTARLAAKGLGE